MMGVGENNMTGIDDARAVNAITGDFVKDGIELEDFVKDGIEDFVKDGIEMLGLVPLYEGEECCSQRGCDLINHVLRRLIYDDGFQQILHMIVFISCFL